MFTNIKFPNKDRKNRTFKEIRVEDLSIRLGTTVWRQTATGPVEHILVRLDSLRVFVTADAYRANPKKFDIARTKKVKPWSSRFSRERCC